MFKNLLQILLLSLIVGNETITNYELIKLNHNLNTVNKTISQQDKDINAQKKAIKRVGQKIVDTINHIWPLN